MPIIIETCMAKIERKKQVNRKASEHIRRGMERDEMEEEKQNPKLRFILLFWVRVLVGVGRTRAAMTPLRAVPAGSAEARILRNKDVFGELKCSSQYWAAGSGGLRFHELPADSLPSHPFYKTEDTCAASRAVDTEARRPRVLFHPHRFGGN